MRLRLVTAAEASGFAVGAWGNGAAFSSAGALAGSSGRSLGRSGAAATTASLTTSNLASSARLATSHNRASSSSTTGRRYSLWHFGWQTGSQATRAQGFSQVSFAGGWAASTAGLCRNEPCGTSLLCTARSKRLSHRFPGSSPCRLRTRRARKCRPFASNISFRPVKEIAHRGNPALFAMATSCLFAAAGGFWATSLWHMAHRR